MSNHTPVPPIRPHLHFLIPSSSPSIHLEARLYLPPNPPLQSQSSISDSKPIIDPLPFSNSPTSHPIPASDLDAIIRRLAEWDVHTLITAAHPWGKMGGNMLDPVIAQHFVSAVLDLQGDESAKRTAVLSYNARGVGRSQGSKGWFGLATGVGTADFAVVEAWVMGVMDVKEVRRFGYSWGTIAAINAPHPPSGASISSTLLVSPPLTFLKGVTFFAHQTFRNGLTAALQADAPEQFTSSTEKTSRVWIIYGSRDEFTGVSTYRALADELGSAGLQVREVGGAGHFYPAREDGESLKIAMKEWLTA